MARGQGPAGGKGTPGRGKGPNGLPHRAGAAEGQVAQLLGEGPHHGGGLDGNGVIHGRSQHCPLLGNTGKEER